MTYCRTFVNVLKDQNDVSMLSCFISNCVLQIVCSWHNQNNILIDRAENVIEDPI